MFTLLTISGASAQGYLVPLLWALLTQGIMGTGRESMGKRHKFHFPSVHPCDYSFQGAPPPKASVAIQQCH